MLRPVGYTESVRLVTPDARRVGTDAHAEPRAACQKSAFMVAGVRLCVNNDTQILGTGVQYEGS
jgi:hypothetical protein